MKHHFFIRWLTCFLASPVALSVIACAQTISTPLAGAELSPVVSSEPVRPAPPTYELSVKWNDQIKGVLTVPLTNDSEKTLHILGVQATGGVFVGDYPNTVASGEEELISLVYNPLTNASGDVDLIRVLTDQGVKEIRVRLARDHVVSQTANELVWTVGDKPQTKSVDLTIVADTVKPVSVRTTADNTAELETVNPTTWRVNVTPGSTAKSGKFPVFVEFDQAVAGGNTVILGIINPKE